MSSELQIQFQSIPQSFTTCTMATLTWSFEGPGTTDVTIVAAEIVQSGTSGITRTVAEVIAASQQCTWNIKLPPGQYHVEAVNNSTGNAVGTSSAFSIVTGNDTSCVPSQSPSSNTHAIIGGAVGGSLGLAMLLFAILLFFYYKRRRMLRNLIPILQSERASWINPFLTPTQPEFPKADQPLMSEELTSEMVRSARSDSIMGSTVNSQTDTLHSKSEYSRHGVPMQSRKNTEGQETRTGRPQVRHEKSGSQLSPSLTSTFQADSPDTGEGSHHGQNMHHEISFLRAEVERLQASHNDLVRTQNDVDQLPEYVEAP